MFYEKLCSKLICWNPKWKHKWNDFYKLLFSVAKWSAHESRYRTFSDLYDNVWPTISFVLCHSNKRPMNSFHTCTYILVKFLKLPFSTAFLSASCQSIFEPLDTSSCITYSSMRCEIKHIHPCNVTILHSFSPKLISCPFLMKIIASSLWPE